MMPIERVINKHPIIQCCMMKNTLRDGNPFVIIIYLSLQLNHVIITITWVMPAEIQST